MKKTIPLFKAGTIVLSVLYGASLSWAQVDTRLVDNVREKSVLDQRDLEVVDRFMYEAVRELGLTKGKEFSKIASVRATILSRKSDQAQYAQQFSESAHKYISKALELSVNLPPESQFKVQMNLLILIDNLNEPQLIPLALPFINAPQPPLRYWALRTITSKASIDQINAGQANQLLQSIITTSQHANRDTMGRLADFAAQLTVDAGQEILETLADQRIAQYTQGDLPNKFIDIKLLKHLSSKMTPENVNRARAAQRFVQLYSQILQQYAKNVGHLTDEQEQHFASIIVETEYKCIGPLLKQEQTTLKRAVERKDAQLVMQEHDRLVGEGGALLQQ